MRPLRHKFRTDGNSAAWLGGHCEVDDPGLYRNRSRLGLVRLVGSGLNGLNLNSSEDVDELETSPASCSTESSDGDMSRFGTAPTSPVSGVEGLTCFIDFAFLDGFGCALVLSQENRSGFFPAVILVDLREDVILSRNLPRSKFG